MDTPVPRIEEPPTDLLRLATVGSVDDGKSTLIGRLLADSEAVCTDHWAALNADSRRLNREGVDLSLLMDGLRAEREQGITIDVAYRTFATPKRRFLLADTPGHEQYTRNMVTGVSTASLAVLLIDAERGVTTQSKRHGFISSLLGVPHLVVAINKMDRVGYSEDVFRRVSEAYKEFASRLQIASLVCIPVSALLGDNVVRRSERMPWYSGPPLLEYMESLYIGATRNLVDLRFPVQYVLRTGPTARAYAGTVVSGVVRVGDELMALPSRRRARVTAIGGAAGPQPYAFPPQAVALALDREIDLSRGDMLVHPGNQPRSESAPEAILIWMNEQPCRVGRTYIVKHTTQSVNGTFTRLRYRINPNDLHREAADTLGLNEIGRVDLQTHRPIFCDEYRRNRATGGFIVIDPVTDETVGAGLVIERGRHRSEDEPAPVEAVRPAVGEPASGVRPVTIWLTGLSGAGKSTLAAGVRGELLGRGYAAYVLDGDVLRTGLSRDLGYSAADRTENIRRAAEVARLMNDAGLIVVVALISPLRSDRAAARAIVGEERFVEVFVDAPLEVCEARDPKGLYRKARQGTIAEFTGISAPYEPPHRPDLHLRTAAAEPQDLAVQTMKYLREKGFLPTG